MARRFRRRGSMRRARSFIRRTVVNMGPIEAKRVIINDLAIPAQSAAAYDNPLTVQLLTCKETVDEELESNGSNIAEVPLYSKLVGMKMNFVIHGGTSGNIYRWMLFKNEDADVSLAGLQDDTFHTSNDTETFRHFRERTMAKGFFVASDKTATRLNLFVKRKTLKRLGNLRENDRITLVIAQDGGQAAALTGFGTLYVRLN